MVVQVVVVWCGGVMVVGGVCGSVGDDAVVV